jgi:predicted nuclease of predicted toxin-antitoxin system
MKSFLIDEDLPRSLVPALSAAGMEAIHVIDAGLRGRSDSDVLAEANRNRRTLITADLDFSNLLQYPLGTHAGIVIARLSNETPVDTLNEAVVTAPISLADDEVAGCLVIIEPGRVRLRR